MENVEKALARIDQSKYEIEVRFGTFYGQRFESSVPAKDFYRILFFISEQFNYKSQELTIRTKEFGINVPEKPDQLTEEIYNIQLPNNPDCIGTSKIRKQWVPVPNAPVFYNSKRKCQQVDLQQFNVRVAIAEETDIQPADDVLLNLKYQKPSATREKSRWSFTTNDQSNPLYNFSVDLTVTNTTAASSPTPKTAYEIEIELLRPVKNVRQVFNDAIYYMLRLVQDTEFPLDTKSISMVIQAYNKLFPADIAKSRRQNLFWNLYNVINKPIDLDLNNLLQANFLAVTDKADGQRRLLYFNGDYGYLLFPPKTVSLYLQPSATSKGLHNTLLDGELIVQDGIRVYLAFDLLVLNGKDIRSQPFVDRLKQLDEFMQKHQFQTVRAKKFYLPENNFYANINKVLSEIPNKKYENDGLVFNNVQDTYQGAKILKWKPLEKLTIDFKVAQIKPGQFQLLIIDNGKYIPFTGTKKYPVNPIINSTEISDGQIVEMVWRNGFQVYRIRYDRETPNGLIPARNVWYHINNPITEKTIRGHNLVVMRRDHNIIKRDMIQKYCSQSKILDIGSGKGGDISKWVDAKATVLAVEPFQEHLTELINRLQDGFQEKNGVYTKGATSITVMHGYGEDTAAILGKFKSIAEKADCITLFNALTFFYINEEKLDALIKTVSSILADGGHFMGIVMDGQLVRKAFTHQGEIREQLQFLTENQYYNIDTYRIVNRVPLGYNVDERWRLIAKDVQQLERVVAELEKPDKKILQNHGWKIQKASEFTDSPYGNTIIIDLEAATVSNQTEYLVDFNVLVAKLEKHGIYLVQDDSYHLSNPNLSPSQQELNDLYRKFVFVRKPMVHRSPETKEAIVEYIDTDNPFKMVPNQITTLLEPEQSAAIKLVDYDFYRIGVVPDYGYLVAAMLRALSPGYLQDRSSDVGPGVYKKLTSKELQNQKKIVHDAFHNFIDDLKEDYMAGKLTTLAEYYPTWEDARKALLIGQNWQWLDLWQLLAERFETNLIIITSDTYISNITVQIDTVSDKTVYLYQHDGVFDVLAWVDENSQLQTIF